MSFIKKRWFIFVLYFLILGACLVDLPYYIDAPGGLINVDERIELNEKYEDFVDGVITTAINYVDDFTIIKDQIANIDSILDSIEGAGH